MSDKTITFEPSGRGKAQCPSDPNYPKGIAVPCPPNLVVSCFVELPYPAPECGLWIITCDRCECSMAVTAAGRPDDPVSVYMPCGREVARAQLGISNVAKKAAVN